MTALVIFVLSYAGIALGKIPGLQLDRVGVALLGAIAMIVSGVVPLDHAFRAIDLPTIVLLYSLMIVSAQLRLGGFYTWVALRIVPVCVMPVRFLFAIMIVGGLLSAVLANDIVCFALTPVLAQALIRARLNPLPFLIGLATASNIGSAVTLIGNPQNMLLGQTGRLDFAGFFIWSLVPTSVSMAVAFLVILLIYQGKLTVRDSHAVMSAAVETDQRPFDRWQSAKGLCGVVILIVLFCSPIPREISAISVAAVMLCSRKVKTRELTGLIDWHLLTLFCALFVIVYGLSHGGVFDRVDGALARRGIDAADPFLLTGVTVVLSNLLSNVPAVMVLQGFLDPGSPEQWYVLALASTFAGNLVLLGSIANLIVVEQAARYHVRISFLHHAAVGVPVTAGSLIVLLLWIVCRGPV